MADYQRRLEEERGNFAPIPTDPLFSLQLTVDVWVLQMVVMTMMMKILDKKH